MKKENEPKCQRFSEVLPSILLSGPNILYGNDGNKLYRELMPMIVSSSSFYWKFSVVMIYCNTFVSFRFVFRAFRRNSHFYTCLLYILLVGSMYVFIHKYDAISRSIEADLFRYHESAIKYVQTLFNIIHVRTYVRKCCYAIRQTVISFPFRCLQTTKKKAIRFTRADVFPICWLNMWITCFKNKVITTVFNLKIGYWELVQLNRRRKPKK